MMSGTAKPKSIDEYLAVENYARILYISGVRSTYSVSEAQAQLPALLKQAQGDLIAIAKRDKTVAYLVSAERMEAIAETLEIMADPKAMRAIGRARRAQGKYYPVTILDEPGSH